MFRILKYLFGICLLLGIAVSAFISFWPSFGGSVSGDRLAQAEKMDQFADGKFFNVIRQRGTTFAEIRVLLAETFSDGANRTPTDPIPVIPIEANLIGNPPAPGLRVIWFGHSSVFLEIAGLRVMIDPMLSDVASPVGFVGPTRFHPPPLALQDLPKIDAVLISHDHYDHMDMATIRHLAANGTRFYVPFGAGAHLDRWGVPSDQYQEMNWWDEAEIEGLKIISTPARHYSGRAVLDHKDTFWSSWSLISENHRVYFSGDSGYSPHFKEIGEKLGPFDLDIMKVGAYGPGGGWIDIHMSAEDAVKAHQDLRADRMLPVHWATFNLGFHPWDEPIKRTLKAASGLGIDVVTPRIGVVVDAALPFVSTLWWEDVN